MKSHGTEMDSFEMVEAEQTKAKDGCQQLVWQVIEVKLLDVSHKSLDLALMMHAESGSR